MKRKLFLMFDFILLALSVCGIGFGVYALQQARLNIRGNIGFLSHNVDAKVTVKIWGDAVDASGNPNKNGTPRSNTSPKVIHNQQQIENDANLSLNGTYYFSDMTEGNVISPITIQIVIVNESIFAVNANFIESRIEGLNVTYSTHTSPAHMMASGSTEAQRTATISVTFTREIHEAPTAPISINLSVNLQADETAS